MKNQLFRIEITYYSNNAATVSAVLASIDHCERLEKKMNQYRNVIWKLWLWLKFNHLNLILRENV